MSANCGLTRRNYCFSSDALFSRRKARGTSARPKVILAALVGLVAMGISQRAQAQMCPPPPGQHVFGINIAKTCPIRAHLGEEVTCTITMENNDCDHTVTIISLTDQLPGGLPLPVTGCAASLAPNDGVAGSGLPGSGPSPEDLFALAPELGARKPLRVSRLLEHVRDRRNHRTARGDCLRRIRSQAHRRTPGTSRSVVRPAA